MLLFVAFRQRSVRLDHFAAILGAVPSETQRFLQMFHSICDTNGWFLLHHWETINAKLVEK